MTAEEIDLSVLTQVRNLRNPGRTFNEAWITWEVPFDSSYLIDYVVRWGGPAPVHTTECECLLQGLTPEVEYTVEVQPRRSQGAPAPVVSIKVVTHDRVPPTRPRGLHLDRMPGNRSMLSWDVSQDNVGVTGYLLRWNEGAELPINTSTFAVDLPVERMKSWQVRARDAAGNLSRVARWNSGVPPSKPTGLSASSVTGNSATLEWVASIDDIEVTGYQIYRDNRPIDNVDSTRYTAIGLDDATTYTFKVRALDADGHFADSDPLTVTTADTKAPSMPGNFRATTITSHSVGLEWASSQDNVAVTGYEIYQGAAYLETIPDIHYTISGLSSSRIYSFAVCAMDAAGNRSIMSTIQVTTPVSNAPTNLEFNRLSFMHGALQWAPPVESEGVTGYELSRDSVVFREIPELYFLFTDLEAGTTYLFEVRAIRHGRLSEPASIRG